jgi:uncharacterized protein YqiB (DUF1249 family)
MSFSWQPTKDGRVRISRDGRVVTTLAGESARRFSARIESANPEAAQQLMARATGNYKRGNERRPPR